MKTKPTKSVQHSIHRYTGGRLGQSDLGASGTPPENAGGLRSSPSVLQTDGGDIQTGGDDPGKVVRMPNFHPDANVDPRERLRITDDYGNYFADDGPLEI